MKLELHKRFPSPTATREYDLFNVQLKIQDLPYLLEIPGGGTSHFRVNGGIAPDGLNLIDYRIRTLAPQTTVKRGEPIEVQLTYLSDLPLLGIYLNFKVDQGEPDRQTGALVGIPGAPLENEWLYDVSQEQACGRVKLRFKMKVPLDYDQVRRLELLGAIGMNSGYQESNSVFPEGFGIDVI